MNAHDHPAFEGKRTAEVLADLRIRQITGAFTFSTPADFFDFVRGPQQHDQHVATRKAALFYADQKKRLAEVDAFMRGYVGLPPRKD